MRPASVPRVARILGQHACAAIGHFDQDGPPVGRVGAPPDQVLGLERVHDLGGRARRDLQAVRQLRQAHRPVPGQHAQGAQVGGSDVPWR